MSSRRLSRCLSQALALTLTSLNVQCLTTSPVRGRGRLCCVQHPTGTLHATQTQTETDPITPSGTGTAFAIDKTALSRIDSSPTGTAARKILSRALRPPSDDRDGARLYDSVRIPRNLSARPISDAELALQTRTINSKYTVIDLIEQNGDRDIDRASLAVLCVFLFGSSSAIFAQTATEGLPDILRWLIVSALCFSPLVLVGYGLALPAELSAALVAIQRQIFPSYRDRMIQHEAGHFLMGHLLGWPVKTYRASNAVKNAVEFYPLSDEDVGKDRAKALGFDANRSDSDSIGSQDMARNAMNREGVPYFSKDGKGGGDMERSVFRDKDSSYAYLALAPEDDPTSTWPFRGFDNETLDKLAVISVAGACAEILAFGNAEGGVADLLQLRRIYGGAASSNGNRNGGPGEGSDSPKSFSDDVKERRLRRENGKSDGTAEEREMDNRTRFAIGFAMGLLRRHMGALDALAKAMEEDGSVSDCILALEECPNTSGSTVRGDHEKIRRERFRTGERGLGGWVERTFLGGGKTIDVEDYGVTEGKGGGERRESFQLTGDDPLYAAVATAVAFFVWASNGGLSLH